MVISVFDEEFKLWMFDNGVNIDPSVFELKFNPPQNFAAYRQSELDNARIQSFTALAEVPYLSKRFAMKRFLGLSQEEITENEKLWAAENGARLQAPQDSASELRSAGITPAGIAGEAAPPEAAETAPEVGAEGGEAEAGAAPEQPPPV